MLLLSFILLELCAGEVAAAAPEGCGLELLGRATAAKADSSSPFSKSIRSLYIGLFSISFAILSASDS